MTDDTKIRAIMIFDVLGRPPKHLIESLEKLIEEIDKEKGVNVKVKDIKEPTFMKDQKDFYTTFAEVEVEIDEVLNLAILLFKYMPAHLEIISPEIIAISNNSWNDILNELTRRLHAYDEIARIMQNEKIILLKKIQELGGNIQDLMPRPAIAEGEKEDSVKKKAAGKTAKKKR